MDLQKLEATYLQLITHLEANGYSAISTARIRRLIKRILRQAKLKGWKSYTDIYLTYETGGASPSYLREKRTQIGTIEQFETFGRYPGNRRRTCICRKSTYDLLPDEFKAVIDHYCEAERHKGKREATIYTESHNAASFLLALYQKGFGSFSDITEKAVLDFFLDDHGSVCRSCSYKKNIAAVFKAGAEHFPQDTCAKILSYLPALREKRKNIQYLTKEEVTRMKVVLTSNYPALTLRDKAIGLLALQTGLRSCDIAGLTLASIDWKNDRIYIKQQKTEVPLELPLTAIVGNAIYDYVMRERPQKNIPEIFLAQSIPYTRMGSKSLNGIANKIMAEASIRTTAGDRKGFHVFRHYMATTLLGNETPQPVISRILGHTSPASLNTYLSADFLHLKECALSIECFPLGKEVLL
jgi:integrase